MVDTWAPPIWCPLSPHSSISMPAVFGPPGLRNTEQRRRQAGADDGGRALHFEAVEALAHPDYEPGEPAVPHEHVGPEAQHHRGEPPLLRHLEAARDVLGAGRGEQVARRAADAVRGVPRQRLVLQQLALELGLGRLGRSGRGFYARTGRASRLAVPGLAAAGSGFPTIVFSCHSWRLLTLPVRLRSAMIASHAALAADMVVVYGTRCTSAARRMA